MKKALLVILDGFGEAPPAPGNAVTLAKTPHWDALCAKYPHSLLEACGEAVGITQGSMGGSEVGHFTMGAGRVVPQYLLAINRAIQDGSFRKNPALLSAFTHAKKEESALHLLGMISDKGVHSHLDHLLALLSWAADEGLKKVYVHAIADGRDVEERSVKGFLKTVLDHMEKIGTGELATLVGRYYAMDRDKNVERTEVAYRLMIEGQGKRVNNVMEAVDDFYAGVTEGHEGTDYYLPPLLLDERGLVRPDDAVIFFNYRTDRTRQLTAAFCDMVAPPVVRPFFVCMGPYSETAPIAFETQLVKNNLSEWLSSHGVHQLRVAETEKYAHVTYFFNSQIENPFPLEDRLLIPSHKVASFAEKPEMSASEITDAVVEAMKKGEHQIIIVNYANGDLVGHSGSLSASIKAVEALDEAMGRLEEQASASGYTLIITADHGNVEEMLYPDGSQKPSHSMNKIPFLVAAHGEGGVRVMGGAAGEGGLKLRDGELSDVAPTLLGVIGLEKPEEMTGKNLLK